MRDVQRFIDKYDKYANPTPAPAAGAEKPASPKAKFSQIATPDKEAEYWKWFDQMMEEKRGKGAAKAQPIQEPSKPEPQAPKNVRLPSHVTQGQAEALERVGYVREKKSIKAKLKSMMENAGLKLEQGVVDQFAPIKEISQKAYILSRMSKGYEGAVEALLTFGNLKLLNGLYDSDAKGVGFIDTLKKLQGEHDLFFWWIAANRAEELKAQGRERLFSDEDIAELKKLNQGTMPNGESRAKVYNDVFSEYSRINKNVLDIAEESGIINGADRAIWEKEFYVPFYRDREDFEGGVNLSKAGLVRQEGIKRLKGGKDKLKQDLLHNVLTNWTHLISASANNRAATETLKTAEEMGAATSKKEGTDKPLTSSDKTDVWILGEYTRKIPKGQEYEEGGETKVSDGTAEIKEHGKIYYNVNDPYLLDAITALDRAQIGGVAVEVMSKFKKALTYGVTLNPAFRIRNLLRDSIAAMAVSGLSYNAAKNIYQGVREIGNNRSQTFASLLASGGIIRFGTMLDGASSDPVQRLVKKGIKKDSIITGGVQQLKNIFDKYQEIGDISESANRAALYKQMRDKGMSHAEAAFAARDMLDFSKGGTWQAVRFLTTVVPFLNARIQGLYKLGQGATEDWQRFALVSGSVALASIALAAAYADDDDWKKREDWDRDNYWWFKVGGKAFRIPKPFEVGAIGTLAERSYELLTEKEMTGKRYRKRLANMFSQTFAFNPVPQIFKPLIDLYANVDSFTGRPIENMGMERKDKSRRFDGKTSEVAKFLGLAGDYTGLSPVQIDHLIRGYMGWLGTAIATATDYGVRAAVERPVKPEMKLKDVFLAGNFVESLPSQSSRYVTQFYEQAKEIEQAYATHKDMLDRKDKVGAKEYMEENRDNIRSYKRIERVKRNMSEINQQIRKVEDGNLTAREKREKIDRLKNRYNSLAENYLNKKGTGLLNYK